MDGVINYLLITNCSKFDIVLCLTASVIGAKIVRLLEFRHEVIELIRKASGVNSRIPGLIQRCVGSYLSFVT